MCGNRQCVVCHRHGGIYFDHIMSTIISPPRRVFVGASWLEEASRRCREYAKKEGGRGASDGVHADISLTPGRGMTGSQRSGLFRAGWRHRSAETPVASCRHVPRDPGRAQFGTHNMIEVCVTMPVANPHYGDENMKN